MSDFELGVNIEKRRAGEIALSIAPGLAWVPVAEAREFAWRILRAARDSEDIASQLAHFETTEAQS